MSALRLVLWNPISPIPEFNLRVQDSNPDDNIGRLRLCQSSLEVSSGCHGVFGILQPYNVPRVFILIGIVRLGFIFVVLVVDEMICALGQCMGLCFEMPCLWMCPIPQFDEK